MPLVGVAIAVVSLLLDVAGGYRLVLQDDPPANDICTPVRVYTIAVPITYAGHSLPARNWAASRVQHEVPESTSSADDPLVAGCVETRRIDIDIDGVIEEIEEIHYNERGMISFARRQRGGRVETEERRYVQGRLTSIMIDRDSDGLPDYNMEYQYIGDYIARRLEDSNGDGVVDVAWIIERYADGAVLSRSTDLGNDGVIEDVVTFYRDELCGAVTASYDYGNNGSVEMQVRDLLHEGEVWRTEMWRGDFNQRESVSKSHYSRRGNLVFYGEYSGEFQLKAWSRLSYDDRDLRTMVETMNGHGVRQDVQVFEYDSLGRQVLYRKEGRTSMEEHRVYECRGRLE